jgi:Tol biopolymer transport system component
MRLALGSAALALALLCGCSSEIENPFANATRTVPPRATAAVIFASNIGRAPGSARELYAVDLDGSGLTQLTFCSTDTVPCDTSAVSPAPDRQRVVVRRRKDANGNSRLDSGDGDAMLFVDLSRGTEAPLVPASSLVQAIDWAPTGDVLVFSANGEGSTEDLFRADVNGENNRNLTATTGVRERGGRVDPTGTVAVYERVEPDAKPAVFVFVDRTRQVRITTPGAGTAALAGTPYTVGSDADPTFSPDGRSIVFRRLTGTGAEGLGTWDIMTIRNDGTGQALVVTGADYRGAPDWGAQGIVFEEADGASGNRRLVAVQPDGSGRRVLVTAARGTDLSAPRWLQSQ